MTYTVSIYKKNLAPDLKLGEAFPSPYLIEVGLQEVDLLLCAQQARPELFLELLLAQHQLDSTVVVVHFAVFRVDLAEQVQRNVVLEALLRVSCERNIVRGDLEVRSLLGNVGSLDIDVEVVTLGFSARGALGPCHWKSRNCTSARSTNT